MKKGIDVSTHNKEIDWKKVKNAGIDFAIIRAGYGKNNIDEYFHKNAKACTSLDIPFGVYWFSYAYTPDMARKEAGYCLEAIKGYKVDYPIAFDYEYDSDNYANRKGKPVTKEILVEMGRAFLDTIKKAGYTPILYTNIDYLNKGFSEIANDYEIWLAQWSMKDPTKQCAIWQYTSGGSVDGIDGRVDMNISYQDYHKISQTVEQQKNEDKKDETKIKEWLITRMNTIADDVIKGKYGNGLTRKNALKKAGYDYSSIQDLVNCKMSNGSWKSVTLAGYEKQIWLKYLQCANAVINGNYGAGEARKKNLANKGYDPFAVQQIVNAII